MPDVKGLPLPDPTADFTADPVELFFDLAFVFAFSQLVYLLVHHPTWGGAGEALLLFMILWFVWSVFTWAANAVQGNARAVRAIFLIATAVSVPMGASVTTAFDSGGGTFAICASLIVLLGIGLQIWGLSSVGASSAEYRTVVSYGIPNIAATLLLIVGGFLDEGPRTVVWLVFLAFILSGIFWARSGDWIVRPGHFAERHGLIVIIALGEIVVAIGISVVNSLSEADGLPNDTLVGLVAAGVMAGLLWWSYFDRVNPAIEHKGNELEGRDRAHFIADSFTLLHVFIVGGIIALAAAAEEVLLHPTDPVPTAFLVMLAGGLVMFFGGIVAGAYRAYRVIARERFGAAAAVVLVAFIGKSWDGVYHLIAVDVILLVTLMIEHYRIEVPSSDASDVATASA